MLLIHLSGDVADAATQAESRNAADHSKYLHGARYVTNLHPYLLLKFENTYFSVI